MDYGTSTTASGTGWIVNGSATYVIGANNGSIEIEKKDGISPIIYFKFLKTKLSVLEKLKLDNRIKRLEKAFNVAVDNGQEALGEKFLKEISKEARESILWAKGYKLFIEKEDVYKHKHNLYSGHISDTRYEDYTRLIPKDIIEKKKKADPYFDSFVILHYWNEKAAKDTKEMDQTEKAKMKDPILFGKIEETDRWYFIADWEDEYCDLTFDKLIDKLGKDEEDISLQANPNLG